MNNRRRGWTWIVAICAIVVGCGFLYGPLFRRPNISASELAPYLEKLRSARHLRSPSPVQVKPFKTLQDHGIKQAALHTVGMETWHLPKFWTGEPEVVFRILSSHGRVGEVVWVDEWQRLPIERPTSWTPTRNKLVDLATDAIEAAGGSVLKAGADRVVIVKKSERKHYEAALDVLGWGRGTKPPWSTNQITVFLQSEPFASPAPPSSDLDADAHERPGK